MRTLRLFYGMMLNIVVLASALPRLAQADACTTTNVSYSENFKTATYRDAATVGAGWPGLTGFSALPNTKDWGNNPATMSFGERVLTVAAGDFNNDQIDDLAIVSTANASGCQVEVMIGSSTHLLSTANRTIIDSVCTSTTAPVMAVGDIDHDGWPDIVVAGVTNPDGAGLVSTATLYRNTTAVTGGVPTFSEVDITSMLTARSVAWHAGGSQLQLADYDNDGRADLIVLSSAGTTAQVMVFYATTAAISATYFNPTPDIVIPNVPFYTPIASASQNASNGNACMPTAGFVSRGGTLLSVADFASTGYLGIRVGSVSENRVLSYTQDANSVLTRAPDFSFTPGAPLVGLSADADGDARPDYLILRSGAHCGGQPGEMYPYLNPGGGPELYSQPTTGLYPPATFGAVLDVNNDSMNDLIVGRPLGNGRYTVFYGTSTLTNYAGLAVSKNIAPTVNMATTGIVSVQLTKVAATAPSFFQISGYVSNDGGLHWETLQGSPADGGPAGLVGSASEMTGAYVHNFQNYGSDLRFKFQLQGRGAVITSLGLTYATAPKDYFTRSNVAQATIKTSASTTKEILISTGFNFPGFDAKLYNYDLSAVTTGNANGLTQVNSGAAAQLWEAGSLLAAKAGTSRNLYSAAPITQSPVTDAIYDKRISFSQGELSSPTTTPSLQTMLGLATADRAAAMTFLTSGMNRTDSWKFLDPGHSSPVIVNPPNQDPNYMAAGYTSFTAAQASRAPFILIGGNDGMLHAFDAVTGAELWAYVPSNLLSTMTSQRMRNPNTGVYSYQHNFTMDGPISVSDVYSGGAWYTVAVVGEALGTGTSGNNYYFAVDVTSPTNPKPLWEWAEPADIGAKTCDGNPSYQVCYNACSRSTSLCGNENTLYDGKFVVNKANLDPQGGPSGMLQAEQYDDEQPSTSVPAVNWAIPPLLDPLIVSNASGYSYIQAGGSTNCPGGSAAAVKACTFVTYRFVVDPNAAGTLTPWFRIYQDPVLTNTISWALDGNFVQTVTPSLATRLQWAWTAGTPVPMAAGDHYITVYMRDTQVIVDAIAVQGSATQAPASTIKASPNRVCDFQCTMTDAGRTQGGCTTVTLSNPNNQEWPQCGVGSGQKCCSFGTQYFCAPVASSCASPGAVLGQTFSRPQMGRIKTGSGDRYIAFFASGYNNQRAVNVGRTIYGIDAYTGKPLGEWTLPDVASSSANPDIQATMPASVTLVDVDNDGYIDRLYAPDLQGRVWKLNTYKTVGITGAGAMTSTGDYNTCVFFDAGDPQQSGTRVWAPIITKPAAAILAQGTVNLYFGTGGDDSAPATSMYKFYAVRDSDAMTACTTSTRKESDLTIANGEWVNGDGLTNTNPKVALADTTSEGVVGDKYWADPLIVANSGVYFSSFPGQIDQINPCIDVAGISKVYSYSIATFVDSAGVRHVAGQSLLNSKAPFLAATGKIRNAAILRNDTSNQVVHGAPGPVLSSKNDVFVQEFGGQVMRMSTPGVTATIPLKVQRWRQVGL